MSAYRRSLLTAAAAAALASGVSRAQAPSNDLGRRLYADVEAYSRWPHHRTGTPEGDATLNWFEEALRVRGAATSRWSYEFPRYDWSADLRAAGRPLETLPLWYEGTGEIATSDPFLRPVTLPNNFDKRDIAVALQEARADEARLAILATFGRFLDGERHPALIACNADPAAPVSGIPTLLVSGSDLDALAAGPVSAVMSARRVAAQSVNIVGRFGSGHRPVVIATPLTGWFACAGERGSGIAVALELAAGLAASGPVVVIGSSGHELENLGIRRQLAAGLGFTPRAVLHVGASLAAGDRGADGSLRLSRLRFAMSSRPANDAYNQALERGGFARFDRFLGEGADWARAFPDTPVLSFAGSFRNFHTPADLPLAATTPALLARVHDAVRDALAAVV